MTMEEKELNKVVSQVSQDLPAAELDPIRAITDAVEKPRSRGILTVEKASESVDIALEEPDPEDLYYGLIC